MKTILFHIVQNVSLFRASFVRNKGGTVNNLASMRNCPGVQGRSNKLQALGNMTIFIALAIK